MGVQEASGLGLLPYQIVPPPFTVALHERRREHTLSEQDDSPMFLDNPFVLFPQRVKRNDCIPAVPGTSIRKVTDDGINTVVGNLYHPRQTVFIIYNVSSKHTLVRKNRALAVTDHPVRNLCSTNPLNRILYNEVLSFLFQLVDEP